MTTEFETFEEYLSEALKDPEFRKAWEASEPAYQVARLRIMRGLTQAELAEKVGTKQPSIARLESGKSEPKLSFLRRVVEALGGRLEVRIVPEGQTDRREDAQAARLLPILLEAQPEGGYTITSPLVPGLVTEADTLDEVLPHVADALAALLELHDDLEDAQAAREAVAAYRAGATLPWPEVKVELGLKNK